MNTKKTILIILVILFVSLSGVFVCALLRAGTLTVETELPPGANGAEIVISPSGIVEAGTVTADPGNRVLSVELHSVGRGAATVSLVWDAVDDPALFGEEFTVPVRSVLNGILIDEITYNFSGWKSISYIAAAFLVILTGVLLIARRGELAANGIFSYRAMRLLASALFFGVTAVIRIAALFSIGSGGTVFLLLLRVYFSVQEFMVRSAPVVVLFAVLMTVSNLVLIRREGFSPINMLGIFIGIGMTLAVYFGIALYNSRIDLPFRNEIIEIYAGLTVYAECLMTSAILSAVLAAVHEPAYDKDYVIVLGCRIRPDGTLYPLIRSRTDRAIDFVRKQEELTGKAAVLIPSGGKGSDECLSEGEAMANYMRSRGIPDCRILAETRSTTTKENLLFSRRLIPEREEPYRAAFSTSNYHVFRSGLLAEGLGWKIEGMGSKTKWYYWPNAYMREFLGLISSSRVGQLIAITAISAVCFLIASLI